MSTDPPSRPGDWNAPLPARLPQPSAAPTLFALGVTIFGWGIVSAPLLMVIGGLLLLYALGQWIREILHEGD